MRTKLPHFLIALFIIVSVSLFSFFLLTQTSGNAGSRTRQIQVAAAGNLQGVIDELKKAFEKENDGLTLTVVTGSSGKLTSQILNGAPFDIFLAADMDYPEKLHEAGKALKRPEIYARGRLIMLTKKDFGISDWKELLRSGKIQTIAIANPKLAPYGRAAMEVLNSNGPVNFEKKLVYGQNVTQAAGMVLTAADIGFAAKSVIYTNEFRKYAEENRFWFSIDESLYSPLNQGVAVINNTAEVRKFHEFLFSDEARKIFTEFGYFSE